MSSTRSRKRGRSSPLQDSSRRTVKRRVGCEGGGGTAADGGGRGRGHALREYVYAAELLSHAGAQELLHNVAGMASGVHALDDVDSASLGVDSVSLFADRLLVRGKLERSLSSAMRRRLMDAPLIPHFLMALAVAWQTADSELDLQPPSSLPRCSSELSTATVSSTQTSLPCCLIHL